MAPTRKFSEPANPVPVRAKPVVPAAVAPVPLAMLQVVAVAEVAAHADRGWYWMLPPIEARGFPSMYMALNAYPVSSPIRLKRTWPPIIGLPPGLIGCTAPAVPAAVEWIPSHTP